MARRHDYGERGLRHASGGSAVPGAARAGHQNGEARRAGKMEGRTRNQEGIMKMVRFPSGFSIQDFGIAIWVPEPPFTLDATGAVICTANISPEEAWVCAHLIPVAPELLEALKNRGQEMEL